MANLLFKSSFEEPVNLDAKKQYLHGADEGFEWYGMLGYGIGHMINYNHGVIGVDVDTVLTTTRAKEGARSLGFVVKTPWSSSGFAHRCELNFYTRHQDYPKLYISRYIWFQPNLLDALPPNGSMVGIMGHREVDPDFGVGWNIARSADGSKLYSFADAGMVPGGAQPPRDWRINSTEPIPLGQWVKLAEYIEFAPVNGKYNVWMNDKLIIDAVGKTMNLEDEIVHNRISKIYVGHGGDAYQYPFYTYTDVVEIWDDMPVIPPPPIPPVDLATISGIVLALADAALITYAAAVFLGLI